MKPKPKPEKSNFVDTHNEKSKELLKKLNLDILKLINYMKLKYKDRCDKNYVMVKDACITDDTINYMVNRIHYDPDSLIEHIPDKYNSLTAYNDKKGETIAICLRYIKNNKIYYHDYNTLVFVLLHEFSHTLNKAFDHNKHFWTIFGYVINDAKEAGIYDPVNYEHNNIKYCNLTMEKLAELKYASGTEPTFSKKLIKKKNYTEDELFTEEFQGINITYNPYFDMDKQSSIDLIRI